MILFAITIPAMLVNFQTVAASDEFSYESVGNGYCYGCDQPEIVDASANHTANENLRPMQSSLLMEHYRNFLENPSTSATSEECEIRSVKKPNNKIFYNDASLTDLGRKTARAIIQLGGSALAATIGLLQLIHFVTLIITKILSIIPIIGPFIHANNKGLGLLLKRWKADVKLGTHALKMRYY